MVHYKDGRLTIETSKCNPFERMDNWTNALLNAVDFDESYRDGTCTKAEHDAHILLDALSGNNELSELTVKDGKLLIKIDGFVSPQRLKDSIIIIAYQSIRKGGFDAKDLDSFFDLLYEITDDPE